MTDPVVWAGLVILIGALGTIAARAIRLPAASGALLGGFLLVTVARSTGSLTGFFAWPPLGLIRWPLLALVCFGLGAEIDLTRLVKLARGVVTTALAQSCAVAVLAGAVGLALGMGWDGASLVAAGCLAASPAALIAVATATRARGDFTQTVFALCVPGLVLALVLSGLAAGSPGTAAHLLEAMALAAACGFVILTPLSRMATRGAMTACAAAGMLLLAGCARLWPEPGLLPLMAIEAGFMTGTLLPNRELVRDALRDAVAPASIVLFALAGSSFLAEQVAAVFFAATLVLLARWAGLFLGAAATRRPALPASAAMLPMAGAVIALMPRLDVAAILVVAGFLGEAAGMAATQWALLRSGEGVTSAQPDDWRARMR